MAAYPYQEGLWELLITALYRAGRQADALATYQRVRSRLADELGLDPGPRLRELEQQVLDQDPALRGRRRRATCRRCRPSWSGARRRSPPLAELLREQRLVEIVGPGGIGKTAVAIATGRRLSAAPGGVWLARLEAATTPDDVLDTLIAALRVSGGEAALIERLKGAASVVILDNCEHVLDAAAALAVRLLDAAPGLRILCTSQVALDVEGETVFELAPLAARRRGGAVHPPCRARAAARPTTRCASCAARSTGCRWRSSWRRRGPRRCRSTRSPAASTIASAC